MATYNKRGYKAPKPKDVNEVDETEFIDDKNSTTAEVFGTLDEKANKAEEWIAKNQNNILYALGAIAVLTIGYLLYDKVIAEPKETDAAAEMFTAQKHFEQGINDATKKDSLFNLALNGSEGKFGFLKIAEKYSGTDAGNMANYFTGIIYLNQGKNTEAIKSLEKFSSKDLILNAMAQGTIGDAFAQKNQAKEALSYYEKAAKASENDITTPRFLFKAGQTALELGDKAKANQYFVEIKEKYETSSEARNIDALIGLTQ